MFREKLQRAVLRGIKNTLAVLWLLTKVMVPATLIVTFLDISGWLGYLSAWFSPFMGWLGLPGEAAVLGSGKHFWSLCGSRSDDGNLANSQTAADSGCHANAFSFAASGRGHSGPGRRETAMVIAMRIGTALATGLVLQWII